MNILVTGGIGFIGSNYLAINLAKHKENTYFCIDVFTSTGRRSNLDNLRKYPNFKFIECDIRDKEKLEEIFKEYSFDIVINFAAETSVDYSFKNEKLFNDVNYLGLVNLLDLSIKYKVKRFHEFSTDEVYGASTNNINFLGFSSKSLLNPSNPYSKAKAKADEYCLSNLNNETFISISRSANVFGYNQTVDKLIPHSVYLGIQNRDIEIYGDGFNIREWVYVNDVVDTLDKILLDTSKNIFHIGSSVELSNNEIARKITSLLKEYNYNSDIKYIEKRKVNDARYLLALDETDKSLNNSKNKEYIEEKLNLTIKEMVEKEKDILVQEYDEFVREGRL